MKRKISILALMIGFGLMSIISFAETKTKKIYKVERGESLTVIAQKNKMTVNEIKKLNPNIKNYNQIKIGDLITILAIEDETKTRNDEVLKNITINGNKIKETNEKVEINKDQIIESINESKKQIIEAQEINKNVIGESNGNIKKYFSILIGLGTLLILLVVAILLKIMKKEPEVEEEIIEDKNEEKLELVLEKINEVQAQIVKVIEVKDEVETQSPTTGTVDMNGLTLELVGIKNELEGIKKYSLEKENIIKRYEKGYDMKIKDQFVKEIMDTIDYLIKQNKKEDNNLVNDTIDDLLILLDNNGIYKLDIKVGETYKGKESIAAIKKVITISEESKDYEITEIRKNGYFIKLDNNMEKVIRPASVNIYRFKEERK